MAGTVVAACAVGITAPLAAAPDVENYPGHEVVVIELTHDETVAAAQLGGGNVINAVLGKDNWGVSLEGDSKYADDFHYRPDKAALWSDVTGQQVVQQAASHSNGTITLGVSPGPVLQSRVHT